MSPYTAYNNVKWSKKFKEFLVHVVQGSVELRQNCMSNCHVTVMCFDKYGRIGSGVLWKNVNTVCCCIKKFLKHHQTQKNEYISLVQKSSQVFWVQRFDNTPNLVKAACPRNIMLTVSLCLRTMHNYVSDQQIMHSLD